MASPTFGLFGGNGAPPPPVFMGTNPTGGNRGSGTEGSTFPSFGLFNNPNTTGITGPMANAPVFSGTSGGLANMSSGFGDPFGQGNMLREFQRAYGKGTGDLLAQMMSQGLFNPQTAAAFLNAMQPGINRGEANLSSMFGAEGSRFGSAAALGMGDFLSQANLNEQQTLASMFMQAQQEQLGLLENTLPTLHTEEANQGGWWKDVVGGLEAAAGVAAAPFTGGASLALTASGMGSILGNSNSGGGGSTGGNPFMSLQGLFKNKNASQNPMEIPSSVDWSAVPNINMLPTGNFWDTYSTDTLSGSGADAIFAS